MVAIKNNQRSILVEIDGIVKVDAYISQSKYSESGFFMTGKMTSIMASFEFDCYLKFVESESQFLVESINGGYEDENIDMAITSLEQIIDLDDDEDNGSFWDYFNIVLINTFDLEQIEIVW